MKTFKTRSVYFVFSLTIFVSALVIIKSIMALSIFFKPLFNSSVATCWLACSEISLLINERKLGSSPGNGQTWYNLADGVTGLAQLSLCVAIPSPPPRRNGREGTSTKT